jgi:hypothetical protein
MRWLIIALTALAVVAFTPDASHPQPAPSGQAAAGR